MTDVWNEHMARIFTAGWTICVDESMSIWHNRWTCPGWVFCPGKPHPYGNEYHSACCALSNIIFSIEIVEGKEDRPRWLPSAEFEGIGKTVGLLLRILKSYFATTKYVILHSGFCVLRGLIELKKRGIFVCALIKKRRCWPREVPGEEMEDHMTDKDVGDTDAISAVPWKESPTLSGA